MAGPKPQSTGRRGTRSAVLRRPPTKGWAGFQHRLRRGWQAMLERRVLWILLYVAVSSWCLLPRDLYLVELVQAGTIATRTYIADRDLTVVNEVATRAVQADAQERVPPVYDFDRNQEPDRQLQIANLFLAGRSILEEATPELNGQDPPSAGREEGDKGSPVPSPDDETASLLGRLAHASTLKLTAPQAELLREVGFSTEIEDRMLGVFRRVLRQGVVSDKSLLLQNRTRGITLQELPSGNRKIQLDLYRYLDYPEQVREAVEQDLRTWSGISPAQRRDLVDLVIANITPNLTANSSETLALRQAAAASIGNVTHTARRGEVIVRKGENVDQLAARTIREMASSRGLGRLLLAGLGTVLLVASTLLLAWFVTGRELRTDRSRIRLLNECLLLLTLHIVGTRFAFFVAGALAGTIQSDPFSSVASYTYAIPFAAMALSAVLLYGRNTALMLSLAFSLLLGHVAGGDSIWKMTFFSLASSLAAVFALDQAHFRQRSVMTRVGAVIGLVHVAGALTLKALAGDTAGGLAQLGFDVVCAFIGGFLASAITSFTVPILEGLLSLTTYIKLLELGNPNLPLLRRLALEAPGTFQHSLAVANLAKSGCEAIGRDSILTHTAALYHDIGKVFRPQYFVENQVPGQNPHDKIQPSMSALILINHVKEGLELGHEHHLPQPLMDAIEQHHGTRLIKFFFNRAQERSDPETEEVREDEFRYPGPKPQTKEMGILMLADAVEAASRTLVEATRQKIRGLLRKIFDDCLHDRQLDHTDLTLGDLRQVEEAFLKVLTNIYHRRIEYPGFDFNRPEGPKKTKKRPPEDGTPEIPALVTAER